VNADRRKILDEALSVDLIPTPRKVSSLDNVDPTRKCRYRRNIGHTTSVV